MRIHTERFKLIKKIVNKLKLSDFFKWLQKLIHTKTKKNIKNLQHVKEEKISYRHREEIEEIAEIKDIPK